jgi:mRNA interferase RelE/StbE
LHYTIEFTKKADKDLQKLPTETQLRILEKIKLLHNDLTGDVKHLTHFTPEYRLRAGDYRILFETSDNKVVIHRIRHRKDAY